MKVILKENVKTLGEKGEVVNVSDGYARNFLFPRKLAISATDGTMTSLKVEQKDHEVKLKRNLEMARETAEKLEAVTFKIKVKCGDKGKLFGSITSQDIADVVKQQGKVEINKKKITMDESIKFVGSYTVKARIHPEVTANLKVEIIQEKEK